MISQNWFTNVLREKEQCAEVNKKKQQNVFVDAKCEKFTYIQKLPVKMYYSVCEIKT